MSGQLSTSSLASLSATSLSGSVEIKNPNRSGKRVRTGCQTCRARKIRCDEESGGCLNCRVRGVDCDLPRVTSGSINQSLPRRSSSRQPRTPACHSCRSARTKCSQERPSCSRCQSKGVDCTYPSTIHSPGLTPSAIARMRNRYRSQLNEETPRSRATLLSDNSEPSSPTSADPERTGDDVNRHDLQQPVRSYAPDTAGHLLFIPLPGLQVISYFVDSYFDCFHPYQTNAFLHPGTVRQQISDGKASKLLLLAICASSAKFVGNETIQNVILNANWQTTFTSVASQWEDQAIFNLMTDEEISLDTAAAALILSRHAMNQGSWNRGLALGAVATRHALKLGLFRESDKFGLTQSWSEGERRRRTMYAVFCGDRKAATGIAELITCPLENMQIQLPCEDQNFELGTPCSTPYPLKLGDQETPSFRDYENVGIMGHQFTLVGIRYHIHRWANLLNDWNQTSLPPWDTNSEFHQAKRSLAAWKASLPERLKLTRENIFARHGTRNLGPMVMIHLWHDVLQCELHRVAFQEYPPSNPFGQFVLNFAPLDWIGATKIECLNFAENVAKTLRLLRSILSGRTLFVFDSSLPIICYVSMRVLLRYPSSLSDDDDGDETNKERLENIKALLKSSEDIAGYFPSAKLPLKEMRKMVQEHGISAWWDEEQKDEDDQSYHPWLRRIGEMDARSRDMANTEYVCPPSYFASVATVSDAELFGQFLEFPSWQ